jgi:hypothetical protein
MYKGLIAASLLIVSSAALTGTAFAGKRERDEMTNRVMPKVKDAEAKFQASCGCALTITVDEATLKSVDEMHQVSYMAEKVSEGAKKYCTDDASKKAVCQLTSLTLAKVDKPAKAAFTFKDGKGLMTTDGQANCTFEMVTRVLDK